MLESSARATQTRDLEVLLRDIVEQRHGPNAATVLDAVLRLQAAPLAGITGELPEMAPNAVRQQLASLLRHEVLLYDDGSANFSASFGTGMLPAFFPLVSRFVSEKYHHAAELVATTLFEFHDIPVDTIVRQVLQSQPDVEAAVRRSIANMIDDQVLVSAGGISEHGGGAGKGGAKSSGTKRGAEDEKLVAYQFNWSVVLAQIRASRVCRFAEHRFGPAVGQVVLAFVGGDANQPSPGKNSRGFPKLHHMSSALTTVAVQRKCSGLQPSMIVGAMDALTADPDAAILQPSSGPGEASYAVNYWAVARVMQRELYEGIVLARHGVVGSRVVRLLAENEAMEDRFVSEEALVTHADARTTLTAMLRDGFVRLLELPKGNIADRLPKNSIFLWSINKDQLLETTQTHVVKALCNARTALSQEVAAFRQAMPPSFFVDPANTILSEAEAKLAAKHEVQRAALQHAVAALLERAFVLFFI